MGLFKGHEQAPLTMPSPDAANRAISLVDIGVVTFALEEVQATWAAQAIRSVWGPTFRNQGSEFPDIIIDGPVRKDPLRTGIVMWQRETGLNIYAKPINHGIVQAVLDSTLALGSVDQAA